MNVLPIISNIVCVIMSIANRYKLCLKDKALGNLFTTLKMFKVFRLCMIFKGKFATKTKFITFLK